MAEGNGQEMVGGGPDNNGGGRTGVNTRAAAERGRRRREEDDDAEGGGHGYGYGYGGGGGGAEAAASASASASATELFQPRRSNLFSIFAADRRYTEHRVMLEEWSRALEASERSLGRKQASCSAARSDLYQILGLFFVFQGVVLTAAAQSSGLSCGRHGPLLEGMSMLVSGAAGAAAVQKLREAAEAREEVRLEKALYRSLHNNLEELKEEGEGFDLGRGQPRLARGYTAPERRGLRRFAEAWMCSYAGAVLFLLLLPFSLLTLFTVHRILCDPKP